MAEHVTREQREAYAQKRLKTSAVIAVLSFFSMIFVAYVVIWWMPHYLADIKPKTESRAHYCDLVYRNCNESKDAAHQLSSELAAEGECAFAADSNYEIRFDFPDQILSEIENGHGNYQVNFLYDAKVAAGKYGHICVEMINDETGQVYIAESDFRAENDLCLEHTLFTMPTGDGRSGALLEEEEPQYVSLVLKASALSNDQPKESAFVEETGSVCLNWYITGIAE